MFTLTPAELFGVLYHYNDGEFVSIDENGTIKTNIDPARLFYPKDYFFNPETGMIEGPENTKFKVKFRKEETH